MSNLQTYYHFKLDFQKVDQHTGETWLIHGTRRHKDKQLQSLELPIHRRIWNKIQRFPLFMDQGSTKYLTQLVIWNLNLMHTRQI